VYESDSVVEVFRVDLDAECNNGFNFSITSLVYLLFVDEFIESLLDFADEDEPEERVEDVDVVEHDEDGKASDVVDALSIVLKRVVDDQSTNG